MKKRKEKKRKQKLKEEGGLYRMQKSWRVDLGHAGDADSRLIRQQAAGSRQIHG